MKLRRSSGAEISPPRPLLHLHGRSDMEDFFLPPQGTIPRRHFPKGRAVCRSGASFTSHIHGETQQLCHCSSPTALPMALPPRRSAPALPPQCTALLETTHACALPSSSRSSSHFVAPRRTASHGISPCSGSCPALCRVQCHARHNALRE